MEGAVIEKFLISSSNGSGYGCGSSEGCGSGYGSGDGYGDGSSEGCGSGYGSGDGYGDGYGDGSSSSNGSGDSFRSGDGCGYGDGDGDGDGDGYGDGSGSGDGCGYGDGDGDGDGSGENISIQTFKGHKVYTIDYIPCYFVKVHDNYAEVRTIDKNSFEETKAFIGKYNGYFAHGDTIREAIEDAMEKCFSNLDFDEAKKQLLGEFEKKGKLTVKELYQWHGILTGSCRFGRSEFQKQHNLKDDDKLNLEEFVNLTKDAFNGEKIRALID